MRPQNNKQASLGPPAHRLAFLTSGVFLALLFFGVLQYFLPPISESLRWQADSLSGEPWRLVSGHFVHLSVTHLLLNAVAFLLIWLLFLNDWRAGDGFLLLFTLPVTGLLLIYSELDWYVGLSAVLHGWFLLGCLRVWRTQRGLAVFMMLILAAKLVLEPYNPSAGAEAELIGGPIAYIAHKLGTLALILVFACAALWDRVRACLNSKKETQ